MGRFKFSYHKKNKLKSPSVPAKKGLSIDDSWKLLDYPTSFSDSDSSISVGDSDDEQWKEMSATASSRCSMPLELTQYSIRIHDVFVTRKSCDVDWGVTFVGNTAWIGERYVRSLLVSDLVDEGLMEIAGLKCGDVVVGINDEDTIHWTHQEMMDEIEETVHLKLSVIPHSQQAIKYLLFLDVVQCDIAHLWCMTNLVSLHICNGSRLMRTLGHIDLRGVSCRCVLQELAVTKSDLACISAVLGLQTFTNLKRLYLNHNKISELAGDIILRLGNLEELRLGNNDLKQFPPVLTDMPNLRDLSLVYNLMSTLPPEITKMKKLENLHVDHNYLHEIPTFLTQQLPALRSLTFSSNQLGWCESRIRDCFHLHLLDISDNAGTQAKTGLDNFAGMTPSRATLRRVKRGGGSTSKEVSLLRRALSNDQKILPEHNGIDHYSFE